MVPGLANTRSMRGPKRMAEKPPKGSRARSAFCRSSSSDLRVTGRRASASRLAMSPGFTPSRIFAKAGAAVWAWAICFGSAARRSCSRSAGSRTSNLS